MDDCMLVSQSRGRGEKHEEKMELEHFILPLSLPFCNTNAILLLPSYPTQVTEKRGNNASGNDFLHFFLA